MRKIISILLSLLVLGFLLTFLIDKDVLNVSKYLDSPGKGDKTYEVVLSPGHYTSGVDLPPGTYTIEVLSGIGSISSTKMYSGSIDGKPQKSMTEDFEKKIENAQLPKGIVLTITGNCVVKASTSTADYSKMDKLKNPATKAFSLNSGEFKAGVDFPPGIYDLSVVEGLGNVSSSNFFDCGIMQRMGIADLTGSTFNNLKLNKDTTITIDNLTISFSPSK